MTDQAPATGQAPAIEMRGVNKWFGAFHVLKDINLEITRGERIVICGPSGSGKSTLVRCINRLEEHQEGEIIVDGITLSNDLKNIDQIRSEVGMVFQSFNLFPPFERAGELHACADMGAQNAESRGGGARHGFAGAG